MIRRNVIRFVSQVSAKTRAVRTIDRINGRKGGVIVVFHEITRDALFGHLSHLADMYRFVSLDEFVRRLAAGKSTVGLAAITFDDGVGKVTEEASSLAIERGWPMTFYLPTRYLDTGDGYWFLEIDLLLRGTDKRTFQLDGNTFSLEGNDAVLKTSGLLRQRFKDLTSVEAVDAMIRRIRSTLFGSDRRPAGMRLPAPIAWDRVKQLCAHDQLSFEAHTINHLAVSRISEETLLNEIEGCRSRIQEMTGREVHHFCYPYGKANEVGTVAPNTVRRLFRSATTTHRGRCASGVDLALLPRVPIDESDSEEVVALKVATAR